MSEKEEFIRQFREINPKFSRFHACFLDKAGLTVSQYALLNHLTASGTIPMTELSSKLHISKPAVTHLVDQLERKHCIQRKPHPKDRRISLIETLPKGKKIIGEVQSKILTFLLTSLDQFSTSEQKTIRQFYAKLSGIMDEMLTKDRGQKSVVRNQKIKKLISLILFVCIGLLTSDFGFGFGHAAMDPGPNLDQALPIEQHESTPLSLADCYKLAIIRSETVGIRKEDIEEAKAQFFKATGVFFGDVEFTKNEFFQDGGGPSGAGGQQSVGGTFVAEHRRQAQFTVEQPLFQGLKSLGAVTGAGSLKKQKENEYIRSKQDLLRETAEAFYDIFRFKQEIVIIEEIHALFVERVNELNEREQIGRSRPSEVVNAVSRMKTLEGDLARARGNLQVARYILEFLTGIVIDIKRLEDQDLENILGRNPNEYITLAEKRPDVIAAENAVEVAWDAIIVAQSGFWPTINLTTDNYELREGFQSQINWDATIELNVPLFQGGSVYGDFKEKIARWKKAKLELSRVKRQAILQVKEAYEQWYASYEEQKSYYDAVTSSNEDFRLQKEDYTRNLVSNLDVLDALERLNLNRRQANTSFYNMKKDYWRLKVAAGEVS